MTKVQGETAQAKGQDGARRAKRWLEATTRVNAQWVNPDPPAVDKLSFAWPFGGESFSFDLGGLFKYGDLDGQMFFAESKKYDKPNDLAKHYSKFIAQCYVAYSKKPEFCDNFMWISWSPHSITDWHRLTSVDYVVEKVAEHSARIFGPNYDQDKDSPIDHEVAQAVSNRLWLIVLSDRQETLVASLEHRAIIDQHETLKGS